MKYKEKLKTCPVCGKEHGITAKNIYNSKLHCKNCHSELMQNPVWIFVIVTTSASFAYLSRAVLAGSYGPIIEWYDNFRPCNFLVILFLYFSQPLFPLSRRRNVWKEFWDKGL